MRLPRDVSGAALVAALRRMGYKKVRQRGSHVRVTTRAGGEHHEAIPLHDPIRTKTLSSILKSVARHHPERLGFRLDALGPGVAPQPSKKDIVVLRAPVEERETLACKRPVTPSHGQLCMAAPIEGDVRVPEFDEPASFKIFVDEVLPAQRDTAAVGGGFEYVEVTVKAREAGRRARVSRGPEPVFPGCPAAIGRRQVEKGEIVPTAHAILQGFRMGSGVPGRTDRAHHFLEHRDAVIGTVLPA